MPVLVGGELSRHRLRYALAFACFALSALLIALSLGLHATLMQAPVHRTLPAADESSWRVLATAPGSLTRAEVERIAAVPGVLVAGPVWQRRYQVNGVDAFVVGLTPAAASLVAGGPDPAGGRDQPGAMATTGLRPADGRTTLSVTGDRPVELGEPVTWLAVDDLARFGLHAEAVVGPADELGRRLGLDAHTPGQGYDFVLVKADGSAGVADRVRSAVGNAGQIVPQVPAGIGTTSSLLGGLLLAAAGLVVATAGASSVMAALSGLDEKVDGLRTLHALGARRRQLRLVATGPAVAVTLVGAFVGTIVGNLALFGVVRSIPASLTVIYEGGSLAPVVTASGVLAPFLFVVVVGSVSSLVPVTLVLPAAHRAGADAPGAVRRRHRQMILVAAGVPSAVTLAWVFPVGPLPLGAAVVATVAALGAATLVAGLIVAAALSRVRRLPAELASGTARAARLPTTIAAVAVAMGVLAVSAMWGATARMQESVDGGVRELRRLDALVQPTPPEELPVDVALPSSLVAEIRARPGVAETVAGNVSFVPLDGRLILVQTVAAGSAVPIAAAAHAGGAVLPPDGAVLSRALARALALEPGDRLRLSGPSGVADLEVAAVVDVVGWPEGIVGVDQASFDRIDRTKLGPSWIEVRGDGTLDAAALRASLPSAAPGPPGMPSVPVHVLPGSAIADVAVGSVAQVVSGLRALSLLVVVVVAAVLSGLQVLTQQDRRVQIRTVALLGGDRRLARRSAVLEALCVAVAGLAVGLPAGIAAHRLVLGIVNDAVLAVSSAVSPMALVLGVFVGLTPALVGALIGNRLAHEGAPA